MKIELLDLTVREIVEDYEDPGEDGVTGYGGKLDIRPPFQREFIYNDKERNAVIDSILDADEIEQETARLILDDDVQRKPGIYPHLLTREEKHLNIRAFSDSMKQKVYEKQSGICVRCDDEFTIKEMEADHITPWSEGGKTNEDNCQMLCKTCNRKKSAT